jgi:hypothetical protein
MAALRRGLRGMAEESKTFMFYDAIPIHDSDVA